jgi:hypothetical protein
MEPYALGSTQTLKISTRILLGVKTAGDDITTFIVPKVKKIHEP